jgi:serine/threonine-protein kinase
VYEGENVRIHRKVAIKVLHSGVAENQDAVQRFEREAQAAGRIGSEHIVEVLDLGNLPDGDRYMVMEFMDGDSLSERIRSRGRIPPADLYPIAHAMLEGLKAAHGAGIIHRDLKPDNVFLLRTRARQPDFVKLLDFGISKFSQLSGESGFSMTRTGAVMGTPYYMSPEQAKGAKGMDHRADLYAVGVILYEAVTGQVPFNADTFNELLFKIVLEEPQPIQQLVPDIDPGFATIVNKAMAREPAHRFQSCEEFQTALTTWAQTGAAPALHNPSIPQARAAQASSSGSGAHVPLGTGTPGTWSSTGSYSGASAALPKKSKAPLFAALGVVAVLAIGGGVAALTFGGGGGSAEAEQQAQAASAEQAAALAAVKKAEEAARKAEEAARKAEEEAKVKAAQASSQLASAEEKRAAEEARLKAEAEARKAADLRQATRQAARAPAPTRPKTADKPAAPAPVPTDGQTGGRKIRTEL